MDALDNWLIDAVFQRFAHWFQRLTGKDNFFLASCCNILGIIPLMLAGTIAHQIRLFAMVGGMAMIYYFVAIYFCWLSYRQLDQPSGGKNKSRISLKMVSARKIGILSQGIQGVAVLLRPQMFMFCMFLWFLSMGCIIYFVVCTPLPPRRSKIKRFISWIKTALKPAETVEGGVPT